MAGGTRKKACHQSLWSTLVMEAEAIIDLSGGRGSSGRVAAAARRAPESRKR